MSTNDNVVCIKDIRPNQKNLNVIFIVLEIGKQKRKQKSKGCSPKFIFTTEGPTFGQTKFRIQETNRADWYLQKLEIWDNNLAGKEIFKPSKKFNLCSYKTVQ